MRSKYDTGHTLDVESLYPINFTSQCNDGPARLKKTFIISRLFARISHNRGWSAPEHMARRMVQAH